MSLPEFHRNLNALLEKWNEMDKKERFSSRLHVEKQFEKLPTLCKYPWDDWDPNCSTEFNVPSDYCFPLEMRRLRLLPESADNAEIINNILIESWNMQASATCSSIKIKDCNPVDLVVTISSGNIVLGTPPPDGPKCSCMSPEVLVNNEGREIHGWLKYYFKVN